MTTRNVMVFWLVVSASWAVGSDGAAVARGMMEEALAPRDAAAAIAGETWHHIYGGNLEEYATELARTADGGFVIVGETMSFGNGNRDLFLIRTDGDGNWRWGRTFGGPFDDSGSSVQETSDGGFIAAGYTTPVGVYHDVYLLKTDTGGNQLWRRTFDLGFNDVATSVRETADGGFIVAGYTDSTDPPLGYDILLLKTDRHGRQQWHKTYGQRGQADEAYSVQETSDGGFIVAGRTTSVSQGYPDALLFRTDRNGNALWSRTFGGTQPDSFGSVQQTTDGGFIAVGYTSSDDWLPDAFDLYLLKTDPNGDALWSVTFDGAGAYDAGHSVVQTADGGYLIAGATGTESQYLDGWLIKTDGSGHELQRFVMGGISDDSATSALETEDGGFVVTGNTRSFGPRFGNVFLLRGRW